MKKYDAIIIGFGKGGKTLAAELAGHDWSVAMVERSDKMYGGTCINVGCIPTKALIHSAGLAAAGHPLTFEQRRAYYKEAVAAKTALVDLLRDKTTTNWPTIPISTFTRAKGGSSRRKP